MGTNKENRYFSLFLHYFWHFNYYFNYEGTLATLLYLYILLNILQAMTRKIISVARVPTCLKIYSKPQNKAKNSEHFSFSIFLPISISYID